MDLRTWLLDAQSDLRTRLFDQVIEVIPTDRWTEKVDSGGSSIAWILLHLARHQDLAIATAIRNHPPLYLAHRDALALGRASASAGIAEREDSTVSGAPPPDALVEYVDAVFRATHDWLDKLSSMALDTIPETTRRLDELALLDPTQLDWLFTMWGAKTVAWFVQWPVIGHGQNHVGEAISVRNRMGLSPF
jgi:hypothetical protein